MPRITRLTSALAGRRKTAAAVAAAAAVLAGAGTASAATIASAPSASAAHVTTHHSAALKAAAKTASAKSVPAKTAPAKTAAAKTAAAKTVSAASVKSAAVKSAPAKTASGKGAPVLATPAKSAPSLAKPAAPAPAKPAAPAPAKSAAPAPAKSAAPAPAAAPAAPAPAPAPAPPAQPYQVYDSVTPSALPAGAAVATYADGGYAVNPAQVAGHPHVTWIDTNGSDPSANALDVEPGDATPAMAATWAWQKLHTDPGATAIVYTMMSQWPATQAAINTLPAPMQSHVKYWIADPTGVPHVVPGASATQWYWGPNYDISTALPGSGL